MTDNVPLNTSSIIRSTHHNIKNIKNEYLGLVSQYIYELYPLLVIDKEWDMPKTWGISSYGELVSQIVNNLLNNTTRNNENKNSILVSTISKFLLSRDLESHRLIFPGSIIEELLILVDEFVNHQEILDFTDYVLIEYSVDISLIMTETAIMEQMFFAAWDIYFQLCAQYPDLELHDPHVRAENINKIKCFDPRNILPLKYFKSSERFLMEDRIIMCINGTYPDLITLCLKAIQLYKNNEKSGSSSNRFVNIIHSQILENQQRLM